MKTTNLKVLAWDIPVAETQSLRERLAPFVISHSDIKSLILLSTTHNRLLLHPRIKQVDMLPTNTLQACYERGALEICHDLGEIPLTVIEQLSTVLFFSKSKPSTALLPDLPNDWRRVLSNFYQTSLTIDGRAYASVEHFFQGQKALASSKPEMALWFSSDFDGAEKVGQDPAEAKKAGSRKAYSQQGATLDINLWEKCRINCMRIAIKNRYEQDQLFRRVLNSTTGMKLLHFERSGARSFWGGNFSRQTGEAVGENRLGKLMVEFRDKAIAEERK